MGIFCWEGEDRLVDKFKGCELESIVDELVAELLLIMVVSTALRVAAASAKECSFESSSG